MSGSMAHAVCGKVVQMCVEGVVVGDIIAYEWWNEDDEPAIQCGDQCSAMAGHKKGKRPSTKGKHEGGYARRGQDRGGEKGDDARDGPRKRPDGYKGPWPVRPIPPTQNQPNSPEQTNIPKAPSPTVE